MQPNYISILQKSGGTIVKISRYFVVGIYKSINKKLNIRVEKQGKRGLLLDRFGEKKLEIIHKKVLKFSSFFYDGRIGSVLLHLDCVFLVVEESYSFCFLNKKEKK